MNWDNKYTQNSNTRRKMIRYILFASIFILSVLAAYFLPVNEMAKSIISAPAAASLLVILYQIFRDESLHLKNIELQQNQQLFNLGAMSHMANVTFDKHIDFCEDYMLEVHKTVTTLFREGPTEITLKHAHVLDELRLKYAAWLTDEINEILSAFKQALRDIGSARHFANSTIGTEEYKQQRHEANEKSWETFNRVFTIDKEQPDESVAIETIKNKIRGILDIEDLVKLRKVLIKKALSNDLISS